MLTKLTISIQPMAVGSTWSPRWLVVPFVCLALLLALPGVGSAQILMGPAPDTNWVTDIIPVSPARPSLPRVPTASSGVDSINLSGLDCSGLPTICTFVEVLDNTGTPVGGLTADSFCVYQDGQQIDSFTVQELSADSCFTSVCLVVDISGSMTEDHKIDSAKAAMHRFVNNMDIYDRVAIVTFESCVDTLIGFTSNTAALHAAITGLSANGNTACFDGIWAGIDLTTGELGSKAVIAFTDGLENRSQFCWPPPDGVSDNSYTDDSTLICNLANGSGIPVYTFNLGPIGNTFFNPEALQAFATGTGGTWAHAPTGADIDSLYSQIKARLCSRYYVCYRSLDTIASGDIHVTTVCHYDPATDSCGPCDSASCQETDVPKLVRTPPTVALGDTCQSPDNSLTICTYVTDADTDPNDLTVRLFYRTQAGSYTDVLMVLQPDDSTFCVTIPANQLTCKSFVDYYLTASDGVVTVSNPPQNPQTSPYQILLCMNPPVASCPGSRDTAVCSLAPICIAGFSCSDLDGDLASCLATGGVLSGDTICFTPVVGPNVLRLIAEDDCGQKDTCETIITVHLNQPPQAACPGNRDTSVCTLAPICIDGFVGSDPDGNMDHTSVVGGTLNSTTVCFTPVVGVNTLTFIVVDFCGAADTCTTSVTVSLIGPPVATCPGNSVQTVCDLGQVAPVPGFAFANGIPTVIGGTLAAGSVTLTSPVVGPNLITLIVTNACGADTCEATVTIGLTPTPMAVCPGNSAQTVCDLGNVASIPGFAFANGTATVVGGTLSAGSVTLTTPVAGPNLITLIVANACSADTCQTTVTITLQNLPQCPAIADTTSVRICDLYEYCLDLGTQSSGLTCSVVSGPGVVAGNQWCYTPQSLNDTVTVGLQCTDACNHTCQTSFTVAFRTDNTCGNCPLVCIDTLSALPNSVVEVCIRVDEGGIPWGGFDFLIGYDPTLITFVGADPGSFLVDCDWEYFTYRIVGGGKVRIVSIADMNNSNHHPTCFTPTPGDVIACLQFRTTSDWSLACRDALIQWTWNDCGDNTISNRTGDTLFIASSAPGSVVNWEGTDLTGLGAWGGPPLPCPSDKGEPQECTHFCGGKIRVICPGEIDDRGDLNLNNIAYEIADAVLYSNYFTQGPVVFTINLDGQTAASDVNNDGVALTVADLVYLIRVITGDVQPIPENILGPKMANVVGHIDVSTSQQGSLTAVSVASDQDLGAALFVFDAAGASVSHLALTDRAQGMNLRSDRVGDQLRVLIYNIEDRAKIAAGSGELLAITTDQGTPVKLVSVEAATFLGGSLETHLEAKVLPKEFALRQNIPNPFNPSTSFAIDFPTATDYRLTIYNIAGQVVRSFAGQAQAGTLRIEWDGKNAAGNPAASGLYFYAVQAGPYSDVRKMVLMK